MLSDRPYMREDYQRERTSFLVWLISALIAGFVVQKIFQISLRTTAFELNAALSANAIQHGYLWTLVTYPLLHDGVLHLLLLVLSIYFIGRELLVHVGDRRMSWLTVAAVATAGITWFAVNFSHDGRVVGATPILLCYLTVFACLFPNREISFLVFFVIPVTTRPKYIAWIVLGVSLLGLLFSEIPSDQLLNRQLPHSAHLGGMLAGWLYYRFFHDADWLTLGRTTEIELPRWMKRAKKIPAPKPALQVAVNSGPRADIRAEVDRILDKINSDGFGALTPEEKRVLDEAKDLISRR